MEENNDPATPPRGTSRPHSGPRLLARLATVQHIFDGKRWVWMLVGLGLFLITILWPELPHATDPDGALVGLSREGQLALGLFMLAAVWWVFEVVPIGVTAITIGVILTRCFSFATRAMPGQIFLTLQCGLSLALSSSGWCFPVPD